MLTDPVIDDGLLVVVRHHHTGTRRRVYNVTPTPRPLDVGRLHGLGLAAPYTRRSVPPLTWGADGVVVVPPYAAWWVVAAPA